jgi:hypothetical protein
MAAHQTKRLLPDSGLCGTFEVAGPIMGWQRGGPSRSHRLIGPISNGAHGNKSVLPAGP